jgi:hypothetical protein
MSNWPEVLQAKKSAALEEHAGRLRRFLRRLGTEGRQGAVGLVIDRDYLEIPFPYKEE